MAARCAAKPGPVAVLHSLLNCRFQANHPEANQRARNFTQRYPACNACNTRAALMSFRQRAWPSGHSRAKHGAQSSGGWSAGSALSHNTAARSFRGGVCKGLDERKMATCGTPNAAATCIKPESLLTVLLLAAIRHSASGSEVLPARLRHFSGCAALTGAAISLHSAASL